MQQDELKTNPSTTVDVNLDTTPIFYTDSILMSTNEFGVILDVAQKVGPTNKLRVVSRIGMSREHAKRLVSELGKLLAITDGSSKTN